LLKPLLCLLPGKSNLMDAVSFVVGVNTTTLRGTRLADFRSNLASADDRPTSVTLFYQAPGKGGDDQVTQFSRTITVRDTSEYRIDGKKVDEKEYQKRLTAVGLLVKSRNFLVFQVILSKTHAWVDAQCLSPSLIENQNRGKSGTLTHPCPQNEVEAVAQKSPKQLTELLERISGSEDLKKDYEELSEEKAATAAVSSMPATPHCFLFFCLLTLNHSTQRTHVHFLS